MMVVDLLKTMNTRKQNSVEAVDGAACLRGGTVYRLSL